MAKQANLPGSDARDERPNTISFRFCLLGELQITRDSEPVPPPPHRVHSLLAALLLYPRPQRRERLIGLLFPDMPEYTGRRRLSDLLWLLRRSLPALPLETNAQEVYLPPETRWLDTEAFRKAVASVDLRDWLEALTLYQGDLLESVYDDWLLEEREALYLQHIRLLHHTCDQLLQRRQFDEVLPLAERLAQAEPYDEKALCTLMQTYRAVGRRGAALAAYESFVSLAADELGAESDPATQALAQTIRSTGSHLHLTPTPSLPQDATPEALLRHAQVALSRGDRATTEDRLQRLRAHPACCENDARLLEIDVALFFEEYDRAAHLLEARDCRRAPELVRMAKLALERHNTPAAHSAASEALSLAHETEDQQSELEALLVLARTQRDQGQAMHAARSAEQALSLARACASPLGIVQALIVKGHGQILQGGYTQALALFQEARFLAHEHGLRRHLAEALRGISLVHCHSSAPLDALTTQQEELSIWRDLGLRSREATALQDLATTYDHLGRTADSLRALEQARGICEELGEPVRVAMNQYHLAGNSLYHNDDLAPQAIGQAQKALAAFRVYEQSGWEAATLRWLGYALWVDERYDEALDAFCQAQILHDHLGELGVLPELLAYQGLAQLGLGQCPQALDLTRRALWALAQGEVSDEVVPDIYYAHAMALAACGEEDQAETYFRRAYQNLLSVAAQFENEPARQAFFHHNPTTRRLMQEVYTRGIAPGPASGVISRRLPAIRGEEPVQVTWTVDAGPADVALKQAQGGVALRRARLSRLIQEAQAQGAAPTVAQLAEALGVSTRTMQRDLATLRSA